VYSWESLLIIWHRNGRIIILPLSSYVNAARTPCLKFSLNGILIYLTNSFPLSFTGVSTLFILRIHGRGYLAANLYFRHVSYKIQYETSWLGMNVSSMTEGSRISTSTTGCVKTKFSCTEYLNRRFFSYKLTLEHWFDFEDLRYGFKCPFIVNSILNLFELRKYFYPYLST
jgi:hypothetical protein